MHSSTLCRTFPPLLRPRQPLHRERQPLNTSVRAQTASSSGSYDSEGDDFLREFQQYADPNRLQNVTKRLELTWSVDRVSIARCGNKHSRTHHRVLLTVLNICCREGAQPLATAVKAQARRNARGAEAQVRFPCFLSFKLCSLARPCQLWPQEL
jgi:hypothetical protein